MTLLATAPPQLDRSLTEADPEVADSVHAELGRQQQTLEMIASENFAPLAVMQAQGSVLTNKYAEGYPGRRYYGGCEHVDVVEQLALDRVKALFGAEAANVQPHSGAQAHFAGLVAAGLHPNPVPHAHVVTSTTHKTLGGPRGGVILTQQSLIKKINSAVLPGQQGGPLEHVIAAKAVTFKLAAEPEFAERQQRTIEGARVLAQRLGGTDLAGHGVSVLTGGTDVHLVLVDLRESASDGKQAEDRLHRIGITVNRNAVPFDPRPPMISSGLRIGTPALATRGFGAEEFAEVADIIAAALAGDPSQADLDALRDRVGVLAQKFPLYAALDRTDDSEVAA